MAEKRKSTRLRELLAGPGPIVMPGVYDCFSLKIVEKLGFPVAMHGGYHVSGGVLGLPDVGLITMTESVGYARNMAAAVDIPIICDVDDGFGGLLKVDRTTREVIRSGCAGLVIEDQAVPRRCPHIGGGNVISLEAMVRKLEVVSNARQEEDPDLIVIGRTYSGRAIGIEEAVRRGIAYARAGADLIWVDYGYTEETIRDEFRVVAEKIGAHAHVVALMTENIGRPLLTTEQLYNMGFKMVVYPVTTLMAAAKAVEMVMTELRDKGTTRAVVDRLMPLGDVSLLLGVERVREFEKRWGFDDSLKAVTAKEEEIK